MVDALDVLAVLLASPIVIHFIRELRRLHRARPIKRDQVVDKIFLALGARLHAVATERGIPIRYVENEKMGTAAGQYEHSIRHDYWGRARRYAHEIRLNKDWFLENGMRAHHTLAHEIGHHIAIQRRGDRSEEAADREARRLILSLLSDEERAVVGAIVEAVYKESHGAL